MNVDAFKLTDFGSWNVHLLFVVVVKLDFYLFPSFPLRASGERHLVGLVVTC